MTARRVPTVLRRLVRRRTSEPAGSPHDLVGVSAADRDILEAVSSYTMTGVPRLLALIDSVRYCVGREVPGSFAECGVWRGGSVLAMVLALQDLGVTDRDIYLYDTFEGMTAPTERDVSELDPPALETWHAAAESGERPWGEMFSNEVFSEEQVRATVLSSGYPAERVHFVRGPVERTIPGEAAERLALLRLDTDWYESTRHEMEHLYPRLSPGGVLIIDDYGHWQGARRAVDEYFAAAGGAPLLTRIDYTGRIAVKP
jgi:hypothetical protein